ncbi:hypothetical protein V6N13_075990 [Hibiscus sabdariffa]
MKTLRINRKRHGLISSLPALLVAGFDRRTVWSSCEREWQAGSKKWTKNAANETAQVNCCGKMSCANPGWFVLNADKYREAVETDVEITWGGRHARILGPGNLLSLTMDKTSGGSGFKSNRDYLFGRFNMQMKLIAGNSAGTVTTFYLSSEGPSHDEIDLEFLGNKSGSPYTLHTNVFTQGQGGREEGFHLWFDPTKHFHTYSIVWNPQNIILLVDNIPIRVFSNQESIGVPYPNKQRMKVYASLWDADDWATRGGRVKTDWSKAPFVAYYRNFVAKSDWGVQGLNARGKKLLSWVRERYRIYYYCNDLKRNQHHGNGRRRPPECKASIGGHAGGSI